MLFNEHLCNDILLQRGGGTWGTDLYTVRGVGSGSRDVDAWCANVSVRRGSGAPSTDDPGLSGMSGLASNPANRQIA